jgi:hypothetical protein
VAVDHVAVTVTVTVAQFHPVQASITAWAHAARSTPATSHPGVPAALAEAP